MAYFVEYQRALRALRIAGIILGVCFIIAVIGRISVRGYDGPHAYLSSIENAPTAHVTRQTLPDGSQRTVVDDPVKKIHAVLVARANHVHVEIVQPSAHGQRSIDGDFGPMSVRESNGGGVDRTVMDSHTPVIPFGILFATSIIMAFIVASLLGGVLSKENDGHLELAWTKPVSRERYALTAFGIDIAAVVLSQLLWVAMALVCMLLFFVPGIDFEAHVGWHIAITLLGGIAWYAALTGWSASLKRGPGIVVGLGWLLATIVPAIEQALRGSALPLVAAIHAVLLGLSYLDPLAYISMHVTGSTMSAPHVGALQLTIATSCAALAALIVFYLAVAVAQWRRVEA